MATRNNSTQGFGRLRLYEYSPEVIRTIESALQTNAAKYDKRVLELVARLIKDGRITSGESDTYINALLVELKEMIEPFRVRSVVAPDLLEVPGFYSDIDKGDVTIGRTPAGMPCRISSSFFREGQSMAVLAEAGSGKTTLCFGVLLELLRAIERERMNTRLMILEQKLTYRRLLNAGVKVDYVIRWPELKINLYHPPPGESFLDWSNHINTLLQRVCSYDYAIALQSDAVIALWEMYKGTGHYSCLKDVLNFIDEKKISQWSKESKYRETLDASFGRIMAFSEGIFNHSQSMSLETLFQSNVVIETDGMEHLCKMVLISFLQLWLYWWKFHQGISVDDDSGRTRNDFLANVLWLDDATDALMKSYEHASLRDNMCPVTQLWLMQRERAVSFVTITHMADKVIDAVLSSNIICCGHMKRHQSVEAARQALGLDYRAGNVIKTLQRGHFVFVNGFAKFNHPYEIRSDKIAFPQPVSEELRQALMSDRIAALGGHPRVHYRDVQMMGIQIAGEGKPDEQRPVEQSMDDEKYAGRETQVGSVPTNRRDELQYATRSNCLLTKDEESVLISCYRDWHREKRYHFITAGIRGASKQQSIIRNLAARGFIIEWKGVVTGQKGTITLVEVTENGEAYLWSRFGNVDREKIKGTGSRPHVAYQLYLSNLFGELGYRAEIEGLIASKGENRTKRVDVLVTNNNSKKLLLVEIAVGPTNEINNALAVLQESSDIVEYLIVACEKREVLTKVRKDFDENTEIQKHMSKIKICLLSDVLNKKALKEMGMM